MKKKWLFSAMSGLFVAACVFSMGACGGHKHDYKKTVIAQEYLASQSTCQAKATYYYSCECGEKGTETFDGEEFGSHNIVKGECTLCDKTESLWLDYELSGDERYYVVTSIGDCMDADLIIPKTHEGKPVKEIGESAFAGCSDLTKVQIPAGVAFISPDAFTWCENLTSISIEEGNTEYTSLEGNVYSKDGKTLITYAGGKKATTVTIAKGVTAIGQYSFAMALNLTEIIIPEGVTLIDNGAFTACQALTTVVIPDSVTEIVSGAFGYCNALTSVKMGSGVTSIEAYAFEGCENLPEIVIPASVTSIGNCAFRDCENLTIYCEAESQPEGWVSTWNASDRPVVWGYQVN